MTNTHKNQKEIVKKQNIYKDKYLYFFLSFIFGLYFPSVALAVPFLPSVPVENSVIESATKGTQAELISLNNAFNLYVSDFKSKMYDSEDQSIHALLSLNPPKGQTAELILPGRTNQPGGGKETTEDDDLLKECKRRQITDPSKAKIKPGGAWEELSKSDKINLVDTDYSSVAVNDSTSVACLLQEIVEYDKLQVNLKIHSLLRDYINTALSASLAQRTAGMISKANLDWTKKGNIRTIYDADGSVISQENYSISSSDPNAYKEAVLKSRTKTIEKRLLAPNGKDNSLNVCKSYKYSATRDFLTTAHKEDLDPLDSLSDQVGCTLVNEGNPSEGLFAKEEDLAKFMEDPTKSRRGPFDTYLGLLTKPQNTKQGLELLMEGQQAKNKLAVSSQLDAEYMSSGGYQTARECDLNDPNCDISTSKVSVPGRLVGDTVSKSVLQQFDYISNAKTAEELAAADYDGYSSTNILNEGLNNYDTNNLMPNQNIGRYVTQFLQGINKGYFDLQGGTIDWASGAMLQIYDSTMTNSQAYTGSASTQDLPRDVQKQK